MKRLVILYSVLMSIFMSCTMETITPLNDATSTNEMTSHTIPVETALENLEQFLKQGNAPDTRSVSYEFNNVLTIMSNPYQTKSQALNEPLLYAVNFEDDGYAILAADSRLSHDIIAITDAGEISITDFEPYSNYVVGEDDDILEEQYNEMSSAGYVGAIAQNQMIATICKEYAMNEVLLVDDGSGHSGGGSSSGGSSGGGSTSTTYSWQIVDSEKYKLSTLWNQREPFNNLCPDVGLFNRERAPAGCVPIAVGQIVAYHEYPNLTCNNIRIDYEEIKSIKDTNNFSSIGSAAAQLMAEYFIYNISGVGMCNVIYGKIFNKSFGFALPTSARNCLELLGYKNVSLKWSYNESDVIKAIDNDCPVFISAIAGLVSGHAWVIDGYIKRNYVSSSGIVSKSQYLVHCNWGWNGQNNGYFASGVFKTKSPVISDNWNVNGMDENYWYAFNTITYDKP